MAKRKKAAGKGGPESRLIKIKQKFNDAFGRGDFSQSLAFSLMAMKLAPQSPNTYSDAAVSCIYLERWSDAINYATRATTLQGVPLSIYDSLSHAHGALQQWDEVRKWGLIALQMRAQMVAQLPSQAPTSLELPPAPSPATRGQNIIAFALFGGSPKYCETAVLNAQEQARLYPHWTCHFYIDDTVPDHVVSRLRENGAEVTFVTEAQKKNIPGPMWRFLAYDLPDVHRVIFRDADSVISEREQAAVDDWVESDARFHLMRDAGTHTELILAGMWGCVGGALPPMGPAMEAFLKSPLQSRHFADQFFLRQAVWPTARDSLLQHDSMFGFMNARSFPDGPRPSDFHVGYAEGSPIVTIDHDAPNGAQVVWTLYRRATGNTPICSYESRCQDGKVLVNMPRRLALELMADDLYILCETL